MIARAMPFDIWHYIPRDKAFQDRAWSLVDSLPWDKDASGIAFGRAMFGEDLALDRWEQICELVSSVWGFFWGDASRFEIASLLLAAKEELDLHDADQ